MNDEAQGDDSDSESEDDGNERRLIFYANSCVCLFVNYACKAGILELACHYIIITWVSKKNVLILKSLILGFNS